jgi:hypothetical protein
MTIGVPRRDNTVSEVKAWATRRLCSFLAFAMIVRRENVKTGAMTLVTSAVHEILLAFEWESE